MALYSTPAQAQYANTYVPIPFEQITQALMSRQQRYDMNNSSLEQQLANSELLDSMPGEDANAVQRIQDFMKSVANKYGSGEFDLSNPEVIREISKEVKANVNRKQVNDIQKSAANYSDFLKQKANLEAQGLYRPELQKDLSTWNTSANGVFSGSPETTLDYGASIDRFLSGLHSSYIGQVSLGEDRMASLSGVTAGRLYNHIDKNADRMIEDPAMRQYLRINGYDPSDVGALKKLLKDEVPKYTYEEPSGYYDPSARESGKKSSYDPMFKGEFGTQSMNNVNLKQAISGVPLEEMFKFSDPSYLSERLNFNSNGMLDTKSTQEYGWWQENAIGKPIAGAAKIGLFKAENARRERVRSSEEEQSAARVVGRIREGYEDGLANMNDREILGMLGKAYENNKNINYNTYLFDSDERTAINGSIPNNLGGRYLIPAASGNKHNNKNAKDIEQLYDWLDVPKEARKVSNIKITSFIPGRGKYLASIDLGEKGTREFLIGANKDEERLMRPFINATQIATNGQVGIHDLPGTNLQVINHLDVTSGNPKFNSVIVAKDGGDIVVNGVLIGQEAMGLEEFDKYSTMILTLFNQK